jgi:hypothetical protein
MFFPSIGDPISCNTSSKKIISKEYIRNNSNIKSREGSS